MEARYDINKITNPKLKKAIRERLVSSDFKFFYKEGVYHSEGKHTKYSDHREHTEYKEKVRYREYDCKG